MGKTFLKRGIFIAAIVLLISLLTFCGTSFVSYGENADSSKNQSKLNYFTMTAQFTKDDHFEIGLKIGLDFYKYSQDNEEVALFKNRITQNLENLRVQEIARIDEHYAQHLDEKYLPEGNICFGEINIDHVNQILTCNIDFSSFDVYSYYYDEISYNEIEGFMISKLAIDIEKPFNTVVSNGKNLNKALLDEIVSASEGLQFETTFKNDYKPVLYFEFITSNGRTITNANSLDYDENDFYHYIWQLDRLQEGTKLKVRLNIFNVGWWYLFAVAIPLAVMAVAITAVAISNKRKKVYANRF